jgi:uncharacterized protein (TIGR00255 family)
MASSMTGFGSGRVDLEGRRIVIEIRSVNHRYLDVRWHVFGEIAVDRARLQKRLDGVIHRGHVDVRIVVETDGGASEQVEVDEHVVDTLLRSGSELAQRNGLQPLTSIAELLAVPGVIRRKAITIAPEDEADLNRAFDDALDELVRMRRSEGDATVRELRIRTSQVGDLVSRIESKCRPSVEARFERMKDRLQALLAANEVDESRLMQEAAILADRGDVTEELERLGSHLRQFEALLGSDEPVGRRLDFLLQEMNREVNTVGSKSSDVEVAHLVVELKSEIEKMREQGQNIE